MGFFSTLFGNKPRGGIARIESDFKMLNGYTPRFTSFSGGLYEQELVRAAINANATHISKLKVEMMGSARPALQSKMKHAPNQFQTWSQFMRRASTLLDVHNTLFITPIYDRYGEPSGVYTPLPDRCELVQDKNGKPYLRYHFANGDMAAIELEYCGIMVQHQYKSDLLGETNAALFPTIELINIQNQGIEEGVKSAATYRFWARINNFSKVEDLVKERQRFTEDNFSKDSGGGILLFPNNYQDIHQVDSKPWVIDAEQMKIIKENVYEYFGVNEGILTNKFTGDDWSAYYEGRVEPFAIQFSEVMTKMLYTLREQSQGNKVMATANRLQYLSNQDKLNVSAQMADRGLMTRNEIREIWNLTPLPEPYGSQLPIRGEYYNVGEETDGEGENNESGT